MLSAWLHSGCSEDEGRATEVVVSVEADPGVLQKLTQVDVTTYPASAASGAVPVPMAADEQHYPLSLAAYSLPFSFGVVQRHDERFLLVVTGLVGAQPVIEHKALVSFVDGETRLLTVQLKDVCYAHLCNGSNGQALDQTCQAAGAAMGSCAAVGSPPTTSVQGVDAGMPGGPGAGDAAPGGQDALVPSGRDGSMTPDAQPKLDAGPEAGPGGSVSGPGGGLPSGLGGTGGSMPGGGTTGGFFGGGSSDAGPLDGGQSGGGGPSGSAGGGGTPSGGTAGGTVASDGGAKDGGLLDGSGSAGGGGTTGGMLGGLFGGTTVDGGSIGGGFIGGGLGDGSTK